MEVSAKGVRWGRSGPAACAMRVSFCRCSVVYYVTTQSTDCLFEIRLLISVQCVPNRLLPCLTAAAVQASATFEYRSHAHQAFHCNSLWPGR